MQFEPGRHEPLIDVAWDPARAQAAIRAIVADMENALGAGIVWPAHELDEPEDPLSEWKSIYFGASGALWAMSYLQRAGAATLRIRPSELIEPIYQSYLAKPDTGEVVPSYFLGEVGILLVHWRLTRSSAVAERLWKCIEENIANPTNEALWGAPGTMVGALHMHEWTGEARWRDLFVENAAQLWRTWLPSEHAPCYLWTQDLYGRITQLIGAGHGFAGNAYPMLHGAHLLSAEQRDTLYDRCAQVLEVTAMIEADGANWPQTVGPSVMPQFIGPPRQHKPKTLIQWCHGSPGMVTGLADFPVGRSAVMDALLIKAGNSVWNAGPLSKGAGLCHGTAGNGYTFLKLYRRTGDPIWLSRARAFAMHAIEQVHKMRQHYGRGRYTLWTGDPGVAVYAWHCLTGDNGMPGLDLLD